MHASGQVISFTPPRAFPIDRLSLALNNLLPDDVSVRDVAQVDEEFSARRSARSRTYVYAILNRAEPSPLLARYAWHVRRPLDLDAMHAAAAHLLGEHDFRSFCALPESGSTTRSLSSVVIEQRGELVRLQFVADGFLHHMVRTLTGTLAECGAGRRDPSAFAAILAACDRSAAGLNAPPHGLYLAGITYDEYDSYREPWVTSVRKDTEPRG